MTDEEPWITEARQEILRARTAAHAHTSPPDPALDDLAAWHHLCHWLARHPRRYLAVSDLPPEVRGLLGPAGATLRATWHAANLLPVSAHPRSGWRLAQGGPERLARLHALLPSAS